MRVLEGDSEVAKFDIIGELYRHGLDVLVEKTLSETDGRTVTSCFQVCSSWEKYLQHGKVWRRIIEKKFAEDINFRLLCRLNGWVTILPSQGGREQTEEIYKLMVHKTSDFEDIWSDDSLDSSKLFVGGLFSCLKLHQQWLFGGMLDGLIKMWDVSQAEAVKKPMRLFEGHEERVSSLDAFGLVLVSGSLDHSVRVWNIETSRMLRVLRGSGSAIMLVKLLPERLAWWSRSGTFQVWNWNGPDHIEPKIRFKLEEDPTSSHFAIGEYYIAAVPHGEREISIYSSYTGQKMIDKDIFSTAEIKCLDIQSHILCLGAGCSVEIWDIERSQCLTVLGSNFKPAVNLSVRDLCVSDFLVVAMMSNGCILYWPLRELVKSNKDSHSVPIEYNLETFAGIIENIEPLWKNLVLSDSRIAFGLEMKFGDVKLFNWSNKNVKRKLKNEDEFGITRSVIVPSMTYKYNCGPECLKCLNGYIDLK